MAARAARASAGPSRPTKRKTPARITDARFETKRKLRRVRCDQCGEEKRGNAAGDFWHKQDMPWQRNFTEGARKKRKYQFSGNNYGP